jgi:hypothetical protein
MTSLLQAYNSAYDIVCKTYRVCKLQGSELSHHDLIAGLELGMELYSTASNEIASWNEGFQKGKLMYNTFTKKVLAQPEKLINGFGEEVLLTKTHYMCEIFRIPMTLPCTFENVMKLACYNALLFCSQLRKDDFSEGIVTTFRTYEMHKLTSYINAESCEVKIDGDMLSAALEIMSQKN